MTLSKARPNVCIVAGYGWSGSGAVIDCLKEISTVRTFDVEYRGIKDPYGLLDLERALTENWDLLNSDFAIRNFIKLSKMHGKINSKFTKYRLSYEKKINKNFAILTEDYVKSLIMAKVRFTWWQRYIHSGWSGHILGKFLAKIDHYPSAYLASQDKEEFLMKTINYLDLLFSLNNDQLTVLDQAVSPNNIMGGLEYFRDPRMIIVDRNPFDVLADLRINSALLGTKNCENALEAFVHFYRAARANSISNIPQKAKIFQFEDLVNDYAATRSRLLAFLKLDEGTNPATFERFDPVKSQKNVGMYKKYLSCKEVDRLSELLNCEPPL